MADTSMTEERLHTQKEVAKRLRLSLKTIQNWRRDGKLQAIVLGHRTVRISESEVQRLLAGAQG